MEERIRVPQHALSTSSGQDHDTGSDHPPREAHRTFPFIRAAFSNLEFKSDIGGPILLRSTPVPRTTLRRHRRIYSPLPSGADAGRARDRPRSSTDL